MLASAIKEDTVQFISLLQFIVYAILFMWTISLLFWLSPAKSENNSSNITDIVKDIVN